MTYYKTLNQLRKQAVNGNGDPRPLVVAHASWGKGYSVFLRENADGQFKGHAYYKGTLCNAHWSAAENADGYYECPAQASKTIIAKEAAMALQRLAVIKKTATSAKTDGPCCKACMHQAAGECACSTPCAAFMPVPVITKAKKEHWPKHGMATAIKLREAKKALA